MATITASARLRASSVTCPASGAGSANGPGPSGSSSQQARVQRQLLDLPRRLDQLVVEVGDQVGAHRALGWRGGVALEQAAARLEAPTHGAPDAVIKFFDRLARSWNNEIERTAAIEDDHGRSPRTRQGLATALRTVEHSTQRGLRAGRTLIAAAVIDPL